MALLRAFGAGSARALPVSPYALADYVRRVTTVLGPIARRAFMRFRRLGRSIDAIGRVDRGGAAEFAEKRGHPEIRGIPMARGDPAKKSPG